MHFCTFLCRRYTATTRNVPIFRFAEDVDTRQQFFFFPWTSIRSFGIHLQKNSLLFVELNEMDAIKFKAARILFSSDVSVAVAVIVA